MPATERPRLRTRLTLLYTAAAVILGAVPVGLVGLGAWSGGSTEAVGPDPGQPGPDLSGNTAAVLSAVAVGLIVVALVAAVIGSALAGRALRPLRELTAAAGSADAERLPEHGELGRYQEFAELSATLSGLYARLEAAYGAQRRFVADASHELRTPLTLQRTLIQVALADPDADVASLRALGEELLRAGEQQERLVAALLALAQGRRGPQGGRPVDLAALTDRTLTARRPAAAHVVLSTDLQPAVVAGADPTLLSSLIANLLDNAIAYNHDGGRVDVGTGTPGGRAVLVIGNTGPLVPPGAVEQILQPFQRLGPPRRHSDGSGLGLAIVSAVADSHGADLRVVANPGGGLTVTLSFAAG